MQEILSTRLRYFYGKNLSSIYQAIESLPFKIEHKSLIVEKGIFYLSFVIPDTVKELPFKTQIK